MILDDLMREFDRVAAFPGQCDEEVTRGGDLEACGKQSVAIRRTPEFSMYPVCAYHANRFGSCVSLAEVISIAKDHDPDRGHAR